MERLRLKLSHRLLKGLHLSQILGLKQLLRLTQYLRLNHLNRLLQLGWILRRVHLGLGAQLSKNVVANDVLQGHLLLLVNLHQLVLLWDLHLRRLLLHG